MIPTSHDDGAACLRARVIRARDWRRGGEMASYRGGVIAENAELSNVDENMLNRLLAVISCIIFGDPTGQSRAPGISRRARVPAKHIVM